MDVLSKLPRPFFVLAPMDDVTDTVFRRIVSVCAPPDLYFTEFVNADGLQSPGRKNLLKKLLFTNKEKPLVAQIWGKVPDNYYKTAQELVSMGFDGIDINMGCPVKAVVQNQCCSALMNNRELAIEIIKATRDGAAGKLPVSVKTRIGYNDIDYSWPALLMTQDLNMLTIHGRTKKEQSAVPAHWDSIGEIAKLRNSMKLDTLIVGNGDVVTRQQGLELAKKYGLDGIMIGRGIFQDPFVFAEKSPWSIFSKKQKIELYMKHVQLFSETWQNNEYPVRVLNKFCKVYINGFDGAKELREQLMQANSSQELLSVLEKFS